MFNNSRTHQDEYIREYAFEPELLINRADYLREEELAHKLASTPVRLRWDEAIAKQKQQQKRNPKPKPAETVSDDKNQIEFEIEAFYYVSICRLIPKPVRTWIFWTVLVAFFKKNLLQIL